MALGISPPPSLLPLSSPPALQCRKPSSSLPSIKSSFNGLRLRTANLVAAPAVASSGVVVVGVKAMAKRAEELKEIRGKTTEEINEEIQDLKGELFMLRLQRSARNEFKSSEFRRMHKRVARMLTVRREREIEEGISKRLSRKLDRKWKRSIVVRPPPSLRKKQEEQKAAEEAEKKA